MAEKFPEHIIQMYQNRLKETDHLLTQICDPSEKISPEIYQQLKTEIHKLVGVSGYFEDSQVALEGRFLDQLLKQSGNIPDSDTRTQLLTFQSTLARSTYFQL